MGCFFNSGSLDHDDLLRQILTVLTACEMVGLQINFQMSDAKVLSVLTGTVGTKIEKGAPSEESCRWVNPLDPSRHIWTSLCSVHGLKCHKRRVADRMLVSQKGTKHWNVVLDVWH